MQETTTVIVRNIPKDVKDRFRAWCCLRGVTMGEALSELMLEASKHVSESPSRQTSKFARRRKEIRKT